MMKTARLFQTESELHSKIPALLDLWVARVANSFRLREESAQGIVAGAFAITLFCHFQEILDDATSWLGIERGGEIISANAIAQRLGDLRSCDLTCLGYRNIVDFWAGPLGHTFDVDVRQCRKAVDAALFLALCRDGLLLSESIADLVRSIEDGHLFEMRDKTVSSLSRWLRPWHYSRFKHRLSKQS